MLEELSPVLRNTNFSCVFTDPEYTVQRHVVLADLLVRNLREGFQGWAELCSSVGRKGWTMPQQSPAKDHHSPKTPGPRWNYKELQTQAEEAWPRGK